MTALPNRDRRAERREATRREILDAAWEIARSSGLGAVTLRELGNRVGMQPPSLYSHFDSKNAIYDAMFAQAWDDVLDYFDARGTAPAAPRRALLWLAETFFDFAVADVARYQLMNRVTIPDFRPSDESYGHSLAAYERMRDTMRGAGVHRAADLDLWTAVTGGAVDQQIANEPGGTRWRRQLVRIVDMYADEVGVPTPRLRRTKRP
jgi:AcrR family transcriptional regulator